MRNPLRLLIIANSADEALVLDELRAGDYDPTHERIESPAMMSAALDREPCDLIIADYAMPTFSIREALKALSTRGVNVPFIVTLERIDRATVAALGQLEIDDFILKGKMARLIPAVKRELRAAQMRRELERTVSELQAAKERLQIFSTSVLQIQEAERRRIALELHDEVGQALTAIKIHLEALCGKPKAAPVAARLRESLPVVEGAIEQVRKLALDLRPPQLDDLGLVAALRALVAKQAQLTGWTAHFDADLGPACCNPRVEIACFRIAQEALTNVARHAHAREVWIELNQRDDELHLSIRDDGKGFNVAAARKRAQTGVSLGLIGMEDRVELAGGQLNWDSHPDRGTELLVILPIVSTTELRRRWRDRIEGRPD